MTIDNSNIHDYFVKPFMDTFKLYVFKERKRAKLTVRVNDTFSVTYYWDLEQLDAMLHNWDREWAGKARGCEIFIGPKHHKDENGKGTRLRFARWSASGQFGMEHRFTFQEMYELRDEFVRQINNPMPWD